MTGGNSLLLLSPFTVWRRVLLLAGVLGAITFRLPGPVQAYREAHNRHPGGVDAGVTRGTVQRRERSLPQAREETAAAVLGRRLYVMGGFDAVGRDTRTTFVLDGQMWKQGPQLPLALDHLSAAVVKDHLYVVGGFSNGVASDRSFVLTPGARHWTEAPPLRFGRGALALVANGDALYALGGKDGSGMEIAIGEMYRPGARGWASITPLAVPRDHLAGFSYGRHACVAGGRSPTMARVDCYDPRRGIWHRLPDLPHATSGAGAAALGNDVLVGGGELAGEGGGIISQLARFHRGRWLSSTMLVPRHGIEFAVMGGRAWVCGGGVSPGLHPVATCTSIGPG